MADTYRVLVTGSREWTDHEAILFEIAGLKVQHPDLTVVHGAARDGADRFAALAARAVGATEERHPADWKRWNRRAGLVRNAEMVALGANLALAFITPCAIPRCHGGKPHGSHGASHCAALAEDAGIPVRRIRG